MKRVTSSVAVLSALAEGRSTIAEIAKITGMGKSAVQQTLGRLRRKEPALVKRTNDKGFAVEGTYKITAAGRKALK
jgi:DNA-binding IclR family transcriptional regulator